MPSGHPCLEAFARCVTAIQGHRLTLRGSLLGKVDEFSESHRAFGLPDDLLNIVKDDLAEHAETIRN